MPTVAEVTSKLVEILVERSTGASLLASRELGESQALFIVDLVAPYGLRAQLVDLQGIYMMLAQELPHEAAVFTVADAVWEPSEDWVQVEPAEIEYLLECSEKLLGELIEARRVTD